MFSYFNDTDRIVNIHPATTSHGCEVDMSPIEPCSIREFKLPTGTYPWVKMWGCKGGSLTILVSPTPIPLTDEQTRLEPPEFYLTDEQKQKVKEWDKCSGEYGDVSGARLSYQFTPSGLGTAIRVKCYVCQEYLDLYEQMD